jgi:RecA/RadA recombinase
MSEFKDRKRKGGGYLVKGLLDRGTYAEIYGPSGEGKTFVVMDLAHHVARGVEWRGHKVKQAPVLYWGFESFGGLAQRAKALSNQYGDAPMYFAPGDFNLREVEGRRVAGEVLAAMPEMPGLIVIDTLSYALMGAEENSNTEMQQFNIGVQALIEHTGACVLIIHHTGKDEKKGARGASALRAALDTEITVNNHVIQATKQRDMEIGNAIGFGLKPVEVGVDEDGEPETSCIVVEVSASLRPITKTKLREGSTQQMAWEVLCDARPDNAPITELEWRQRCEFLSDTAADKKAFAKAKFALKRARLITQDDENLIRRSLE